MPLIHRYFKNWTIKFEEELQTEESMIIMHPHGILNLGYVLNYIHYPSVNLAGSRALILFPGVGLFIKLLGGVSVDPGSLKKLFK